MEQIYGPQYKIVIDSTMESGTNIMLRIPMVTSEIMASN